MPLFFSIFHFKYSIPTAPAMLLFLFKKESLVCFSKQEIFARNMQKKNKNIHLRSLLGNGEGNRVSIYVVVVSDKLTRT